MKLPRRTFLHLAAGAAALPAVSRTARAQAYPSRPITMIVPFAPGGLTDVIGRILAEGMRTSLGQPVIIENVGRTSRSERHDQAHRPRRIGLCEYDLRCHWQRGSSYGQMQDVRRPSR